MPISLKRATIQDIPALLSIEKSVAGTKIYSPMLEESEWIEEFDNGPIYLIEKDGIVVGNISYEKKSDDRVYISGLAIDSHFQNQGIAREVLGQILESLKDIKRIDLMTHPENTVALKLYQSLGFVIESRKENYYGDGEPRLVLALERD